MTTTTEVLRQARDALAYLLPLAEMQPADIEPGHHLMQGDCPDETQPSSRDEACPACQRMISAAELIAAIDAMPSAPSRVPTAEVAACLPDGAEWGDTLTPMLARNIVEAARATASVAEMRPECDSSKLCAVHGPCAGQYWTEKQCGAAPQAVPAPADTLALDLLQAAGHVTPEKVQHARDIAAPLAAAQASTAAATDPLFLLHCGHIDSDGEQDRWDCEADSGARVDAFARKHPGQTVRLYAHPAPEVVTEPVLWQYRWTNPGNSPDVDLEDMEWRDVVPERIEKLRAYRYDGKPIYEVRSLYAKQE